MRHTDKIVRTLAYLLMVFAVAWIGWRVYINSNGPLDLTPQHRYEVSYVFDVENEGDYWMRTFLPKTNVRQNVWFKESEGPTQGVISDEDGNLIIRWEGELDAPETFRYTFVYEGRPVVYHIDPEMPFRALFNPAMASSLQPTPYIQADHPKIMELSEFLVENTSTAYDRLHALFQYVYAMPAIASSELTDAVTALERFEASCNGKSRLFAALCRSQQIPTRLVGGLILEDTQKKTSHLWTEVNVEGQWIPMDALNGHFASLPDHYMELYRGDEFLIKRKGNIGFDYMYHIKKQRINHYPEGAMIDLWQISDVAGIPAHILNMLLLLPLGAFLVVLFRNVIGLKTYGVFLPVLVCLAFIQTGITAGMILFTAIVMIVALVSFPLERWGIQYTSKISLMLIAVVGSILIGIKILSTTGWLSASAPLFFPIIILTVISERLAKKIEEDGVNKAMGLYAQTLIVTLFAYFILSSPAIQHFVMTFPESILGLVGLNLLLGKWIGIRVAEYHRFYKLTGAK